MIFFPKCALCFIITYDSILEKPTIWMDWIEANIDILNVYFLLHPKLCQKLHTGLATLPAWMTKHPSSLHIIQSTHATSYLHVVPAYEQVLQHAFAHTEENQWFITLTESCCPLVTPEVFRTVFFQHGYESWMSCSKATWNLHFHTRANLRLLDRDLQLVNDPWFILTRSHLQSMLLLNQSSPTSFWQKMRVLVCKGGLANESLFAISFRCLRYLDENGQSTNRALVNRQTHATDWTHRNAPTRPHTFSLEKKVSEPKPNLTGETWSPEKEKEWFDQLVHELPDALFVRKVHASFPDEWIRQGQIQHSTRWTESNAKSPMLKNREFVMYAGLIASTFALLCIFFFFL